MVSFRGEHFADKGRLIPTTASMLPEKVEDLSTPLTDFWETDKEFKAEIDLPGIDKKDIKLNIKKGLLEIKAEKKHEKEEKKKGVHRIERSFKGFYRSFSLPENADEEKADANYENGVLKISIPKKELPEYKPKQIEVK